MKFVIFSILFTGFQAFALNGSSQNRIDLDLKNRSIKEVLKRIESEYEYRFAYNDEVKSSNYKVDIYAKNATIDEVMNQLLTDTPYGYKKINRGLFVIIGSETFIADEVTLITGKVTDEANLPLSGVSVLEKGTANGTTTNKEGVFVIDVQTMNATLILSSIGYETIEILANAVNNSTVILKSQESNLDDIVVVGYSTQRKENVTGAVDVISKKQIQNRQSPTVSQLLQGVSPAMTFSTDNYGFQPGAKMDINIRGIGSLNGGEPYVLIDGIPGDMNRINPEDIESISVLKDAAASAIYGARAPYGVILITTKSGNRNDKMSVSYSGNITRAAPQRLPAMLNSYTHARIINEAGVWGAGGRVFDNATIDRIIAYQNGDYEYLKQFTVPDAVYFETVPLPNGTWGINQQGNANYDWFDEYYGNALNQKHDVSVSGGTQKLSYYLSGGFTGQEGVLNYGTDKFKRVNFLAKIKTALRPWWDLGYQPRFMKSNRILPAMDKQGEYDLVFHQIARTMPTNAKYDAYGNVMIQSKIPWINDAGTDNIETTEQWHTFVTEIRPLKGWKINADFAYQTVNVFRSHQEFTVYEVLVDKSVVPTSNTVPSNIRQYHHNNIYWTTNVYSSYDFNLGKNNNFTFLTGTQLELTKERGLDVYKTNLLVPDVPSLQTASGEPSATEGLAHWSTQGYFARLNYSYSNRYLLELNVRKDGTSRFREGNRWGTFPSVSAGWNVSNEKFWNELKNSISTFKIRGSWGSLGNQNVESYLDLNLIPIQTNPLNWIFGFGQSRPIGYTNAPGLISPDLTWETATTTNVGLDLGLVANRLTASFDFFERITTNMIGPAQAQPGVLGTILPRANNSTLNTKGWELSIRWNQPVNNNFSYFINANIFDARTYVTKYNNPTGLLSNWYKGKEQGEIWGYTSNDLYRSKGDVEAHQSKTDLSFIWSGTWNPGDVKYEDLNGDGKVNNGSNTISSHGDLLIIGNTTPRYQYGVASGFSLYDFDFSMIWKGTAKRQIFFQPDDNIFWGFRHYNQVSLFKEHLDYFRDNEGDKYTGLYEGSANINLGSYWPRPYINDAQNARNREPSTRYLQSAAYLRLQNLQIGYNVRSPRIKGLGIELIRLYLSGENLITITKLHNGLDPTALQSARGAGKTYGADRMISFGLNVIY